MSNRFKVSDFQNIKPEQSSSASKLIKEDVVAKQQVVQKFEYTVLKSTPRGSGKGESSTAQTEYDAVKAKYGPLATTDPERAGRSQRDRRFYLNSLLKESLSVEEEEKRVLEEKVRERIDAISAEAKEKAALEGYEVGLKRGYEEAYRKIQGEGLKSLEKFDELVQHLEKAKIEIFKANERFLIDLIYRIAKMVILKDLSADSDYLLRLAQKLIDQIGLKDNIIVRINPQDAESIEMMGQGLKKHYRELQNLSIEVSNKVSPGGCQVETEWNALDARVEAQLQKIYEALLGAGSPSAG